MALSGSLEALARVFVAACVGTTEDARRALTAARQSGTSAREVDEVLLLVIAYAGVPRAILAFTEWRQLEPEASDATPIDDRRAAGEKTFESVYGVRAARIRAELRGLHPALHDAIIEDSYGRILARTGLSASDRELLAVAMLVALGAPRQAAAHAIGARRAGAGVDDVLEAVALSAPYRDPDGIAEARRGIAEMLKLAG